MPTDLMMGRKTGASTTMVASVSMNMPRKNSSAAMSSRIRMGLVVYSIIWAASCCGIWYMVRNRPKMVDHAHDDEDGPGGGHFASFMALDTSTRGKLLGDEEADEKERTTPRRPAGFHGRAYARVDAAEDDHGSHEGPDVFRSAPARIRPRCKGMHRARLSRGGGRWYRP